MIYHTLPKDPDQRKIWLDSSCLNEIDIIDNEYPRVCSQHFCREQYDKGNKWLLKSTATPCKLLPLRKECNGFCNRKFISRKLRYTQTF